jgi:hypothetical protein
MRNNKKLVGVTLAAAAALTFASVPVTSALAAGASTDVQCFGINGCKGQGSCKGASNACKGENSCKGKGFVMKSSADDCTNAGGTTS